MYFYLFNYLPHYPIHLFRYERTHNTCLSISNIIHLKHYLVVVFFFFPLELQDMHCKLFLIFVSDRSCKIKIACVKEVIKTNVLQKLKQPPKSWASLFYPRFSCILWSLYITRVYQIFAKQLEKEILKG